MKTIVSFFAKTWRDTSRSHRVAIGLSALYLVALALTLAHVGCATTSSGLAREQAIYKSATNAVAGVQQVAPYLPPPASNFVELALAIVSGGLAAWNGHQQLAIRKLRNGNGKLVASASPAASPAPPASPH